MSLAVEIAIAERQAEKIRKAKAAMENEKYLARKLAEREVEIEKLKRENESLKRKIHDLKVEQRLDYLERECESLRQQLPINREG